VPIVDGIIQVATDGSGKKVDQSEVVVGANTTYRQRVNISDPETVAAHAKVTNAAPGASDYGLVVREAGAVTLADTLANPTVPMVGAALLALDGTTWRRLKADPTNARLIVADAMNTTAADGAPNTNHAWLSDNFGNACIIDSAGYLYNGTTWDRLRNITPLTLLASAARTVTTASADQTNYNGCTLTLYVNVTVIGTGSVTPSLSFKDPVSGTAFVVWTAAAAIVANGLYVYAFGLGSSDGLFTENEAFGLAARTWLATLTSNNANTVTASLGAVVGV